MHIPMPEGTQISIEIPDKIKLAIADSVIVFGRIEQEIIEIAWIMSDANLKHRLKIARKPTIDNFLDIITAVEKAGPEQEFKALRDTIEQLTHDRNLIVHGSWRMADEKPWVVWHKFVEDTESVIGEYFDLHRLERFIKKCAHLLKMLQKFHSMLELQSGIRTTSIPRY